MFNLKLSHSAYFTHPLLDEIKFICENLNENYYLAINEKHQLVSIKNRETQIVFDLNEELNKQLNEDLDKQLDKQLIAFGHLPDSDLICLIYDNGTICTINLDTKQFDQIQFNQQLITADFSPECDKIILTTQTKLILLNCFFEEINQTELNDQKQGAVDVLNVGWGKKGKFYLDIESTN